MLPFIPNVVKVNRNLRWLLLDTAISTMGSQFTAVAMPWLALKYAGGPAQLAAVIAVMGLPHLLLILLGGAVTDRYSPRAVLAWTNYINAALLFTLAAIVLAGMLTTSVLLGIALCIGICSAFAVPATNALLPRAVPSEILVPANAKVMGVRQIATLIGPVAAGALISFMTTTSSEASAAGLGFAFLINAAAFISAGVIIRMIVLQPICNSDVSSSASAMLRAVADGFVHLWRDIPLRSFVIYYALMALLVAGPAQVGFPVLADRRLSHGAVSLGLLITSFSGGILLGMTIAGTWQRVRFATLGLTIIAIDFVAGLAFATFGYVSSTIVTVLLCVLIGTGAGYVQVALISWIQGRIPPAMIGRQMSIVLFVSTGMTSASAAMTGQFLQLYSLATLFLTSGLAIAAVALGAAFRREIRTIDSAQVPRRSADNAVLAASD